jgi:hypothetical protein
VVFVLDMGEPVHIVELARDMIRLSGASEDDIRIVFTGLRSGEKLFEELLANDETTLATPHAKLRVYRSMEPPGPVWYDRAVQWVSQIDPLGPEHVRGGLMRFVPEYKPSAGLPVAAVEREPLQFSADLPGLP